MNDVTYTSRIVEVESNMDIFIQKRYGSRLVQKIFVLIFAYKSWSVSVSILTHHLSDRCLTELVPLLKFQYNLLRLKDHCEDSPLQKQNC